MRAFFEQAWHWFYLRYGIEWQLWYKALGNDKDIALCDIAALEVIRIFIICYLKTIKETRKPRLC
jgi:hypothetical protein